MDYFGSKSQKSHFWLMQTLGNFGEKRNLYFIFSTLPSCLKIVSYATEGCWYLSVQLLTEYVLKQE